MMSLSSVRRGLLIVVVLCNHPGYILDGTVSTYGKSFMIMIKSRGPITDPWVFHLLCLASLNMNCVIGHVEFCEPAMLQSSPVCFPLFHKSPFF